MISSGFSIDILNYKKTTDLIMPKKIHTFLNNFRMKFHRIKSNKHFGMPSIISKALQSFAMCRNQKQCHLLLHQPYTTFSTWHEQLFWLCCAVCLSVSENFHRVDPEHLVDQLRNRYLHLFFFFFVLASVDWIELNSFISLRFVSRQAKNRLWLKSQTAKLKSHRSLSVR